MPSGLSLRLVKHKGHLYPLDIWCLEGPPLQSPKATSRQHMEAVVAIQLKPRLILQGASPHQEVMRRLCLVAVAAIPCSLLRILVRLCKLLVALYKLLLVDRYKLLLPLVGLWQWLLLVGPCKLQHQLHNLHL